LRVKIWVSAPLLGVPIPGSENPYLAAPVSEIVSEFSLSEGCSVSGLEGWARSALASFLSNLSRGLELEGCISSRLEGTPPPYQLGVYASLTAAAVYAVARMHGEKLSTLEIIEVARLADPEGIDHSLRVALEALRYASLEGRVSVYRNEEEHSTLPQPSPRVEFGGSAEAEARISRESVGTDVYGAVIHLMGVAVLEAAVRLREGAGLLESLRALKPVHDAVAAGVWGLAPPAGDCLWVPDSPGLFRLACLG
jgi:hypothetical protein